MYIKNWLEDNKFPISQNILADLKGPKSTMDDVRGDFLGPPNSSC